MSELLQKMMNGEKKDYKSNAAMFVGPIKRLSQERMMEAKNRMKSRNAGGYSGMVLASERICFYLLTNVVIEY